MLMINLGEIFLDVYEVLLKKNYDDDKDFVNFNYEILWWNGLWIVMRILFGSVGFFEIV